MAYSEQEGTYRHAGKNMGEIAHLYPRSRNSATVFEIWLIRFSIHLSFREAKRRGVSVSPVMRKTEILALLGMTTMRLLRPSLHRLLNYFKSAADFFFQLDKINFEHGLLRIDHYIDRNANARPMQTN